MKKQFNALQVALSALVIVSFLAIPFNSYGQAGKVNFAGTWALNAEKSNMGQPPQGQPAQGQGQGQRMGGFGGGMGQAFTVTQDAAKLTTERTRRGQDGQETKVTTVYTLDGKESVNNTGRGESKSTATWSADGKALTIKTTSTFNFNGESRTSTTTQVWTLEGNALTIKSTMPGRDGAERTTTMVYDKK